VTGSLLPDDLTAGAIVVIALAVFAGAFIQTVAGLGMGLVAAPAVALVEPSLMPTLPLWFGLFVSTLSVTLEHRHIDWRAIRWTLPARAVGTLPGVWLVAVFTSEQLGVALAAMVLLAVLLSWHTIEVPVTRGTMIAAGFAGGVGGTATSIAGPPVALLFQHRRPSQVRATLAVFFSAGVVMSLAALAVVGELAPSSFVVAAVISPFVVVGLWLGARMRGSLPRQQFRHVVLAVCAASAVVLVVRSLL
jgi:uncharacterized membrane protein YfcA